MDDTIFFSYKNLVLKQKNYTQFERNKIYVSTLQLSMFYQSYGIWLKADLLISALSDHVGIE